MNQTFSFARFARLHRWLWATKRRTYLIGMGALALLALLYLSGVLNTDGLFKVRHQVDHMAVFFIVTLLVAVAMGSDVFSALFRQDTAITYLMIPASRAEKFWLGALYCLTTLLLLAIIFFGLEAIFFQIANGRLRPGQTQYVPSLRYFGPGGQTKGKILSMIAYSLPLATGAALLGSFFFRRGVFIRNAVASLLAFVVFYLLYQWIVGSQFSGMEAHTGLPFTNASIEVKEQWTALQMPAWITYFVYGFILLLLWITARVRFNEVER